MNRCRQLSPAAPVNVTQPAPGVPALLSSCPPSNKPILSPASVWRRAGDYTRSSRNS
jgi:hypothetical protein